MQLDGNTKGGTSLMTEQKMSRNRCCLPNTRTRSTQQRWSYPLEALPPPATLSNICMVCVRIWKPDVPHTQPYWLSNGRKLLRGGNNSCSGPWNHRLLSGEGGESRGDREAEHRRQARFLLRLLGGLRNHGPDEHDQQCAGGEAVDRRLEPVGDVA